MANGIDPAILAQFQQNGWTPPQSATAVNVMPPPAPPPPAPLQASGDVYNSPQMQSLLQPATQLQPVHSETKQQSTQTAGADAGSAAL